MRRFYVAIALALLFGCFGLHEFYVGNKTYGILSMIFFWTGIPSVCALIRAACWLYKGEYLFSIKYNK